MLQTEQERSMGPDNWEKSATVRNRPRKILSNYLDGGGYFYPISRQPVSIHPEVEKLGEKAKEYVLIQSLYKYAHDIAFLETEIINRISLYISHKDLGVDFDNKWRLEALSIVVDESYHAYVALDAMMQIQQETKVLPLNLETDLSIDLAMDWLKSRLDRRLHKIAELICVCIAENTLTKEIVTMMGRKETNKFFKAILKDHLTDEARHSKFFCNVLSYTWAHLDELDRVKIGQLLPEFIERYLDTSIQQDFDKSILRALGMNEPSVEKVIYESHGDSLLNINHPMIKNIMSLLEVAEVLKNRETHDVFTNKKWINA